mgnify:CR=1 FL=1
MELFREDGCMTDAGFRAMMDGQLDELGRLEAAEHLAYCDRCMDRYTALLTADALEMPPHSAHKAVMTAIWVRLMQNTYGRVAVASVAAVLALTMWKTGALGQITRLGSELNTVLPASQTQPVEEDRPAVPEPQGKPVETRADRDNAGKLSGPLQRLLDTVPHTTESNATT